MLSRSIARIDPLTLSGALHAAFFAVAAILALPGPGRRTVTMEIIENPIAARAAAPPLEIKKPKPIPKPQEQAVFGVSSKSITAPADAPNEGIDVKAGNTVAKAFDDIKLKPEDDQALPVPADEYLVTAMPKLVSDVRVPYPADAKARGVEGVVLVEILIDAVGAVRQAVLVEGPGHGLNEAALEALKRFRFEPARVGEQAVATRIRYAYRFVLDR